MIQDLLGDRNFYKTFFKLAVPVTLQYFFAASLNLIDNIMVGQLGAIELAAVGLANQVYFLLLLFLLGISGGASIFASQFWGAQDIKNVRRILGLSTIISAASALVFFLVSFFNAQAIIGLFSDDAAVIKLGGEFLATSSFSYVLMAITACYAAVLRSAGEVKLPMMVNIIALVANTVLNYVLIFGRFGLPELGVKGSAIATLIARLVEILLLLTIAYRYKYIVAAKLSELVDISADMVKRFVNTTGTVVVKDVIWAIGVILYMVIYAKMGTEVVAAVNIVTTIRQLAFVLFNGIAGACLVMVGHQIGAGNDDKAFLDAKRLLILTSLIGVVVGVLTIAGSKLILSPYNVSANVLRESQAILFVFALFIPFTVFNMVAVVGVLRSGGDAMFCLIMDLVAVYVIGMPLAFLGQSVWKLSVAAVFALITAQELFKFVLCWMRFISKRWINNLITEFSCDPATVNE
jgi:putative MATE family efflux protein